MSKVEANRKLKGWVASEATGQYQKAGVHNIPIDLRSEKMPYNRRDTSTGRNLPGGYLDGEARLGAGIQGTVRTLNNSDTVPHSSPDPHTPNSIPHTPPLAQRQRDVNGKPAQRIRNPSIGK